MVEELIEALCKGDYLKMASLFAKDCRYFDFCPYLTGQNGYFVYGKEAIEMFFRNRFVQGHFEAASPKVIDNRTADFFGSYDGPFIFAKLVIEEIADNGLIQKVVVSPTCGV